jgi:tellurite resistance protein TerC
VLDVSLWAWGATVAFIVILLVVDLLVVDSHPHEVKMREAALWSVFYVAVALLFGVGLWIVGGSQAGVEYYAGWLVEKSLSVDNLFVFVIIMARFAVPTIHQHKVLLFGVVLALLLRSVFIAVGAAAIARFSFTFILFGTFLIWTALQLFRHRNEDAEPSENAILRYARRVLPISDDYDGGKLRTRINGKWMLTPMFVAFLAIGTTDVLFAIDSIPAVFGVTQDPYIVFTANAFALLGLRALFFVLRGLLDKLIYLSTGLSVILAFIGVKLILTYFHEVNTDIPKIPTFFSLSVIIVVLTVTTIASLVAVRRDPTKRAHSGIVIGSDHGEGDASAAGTASGGSSDGGGTGGTGGSGGSSS